MKRTTTLFLLFLAVTSSAFPADAQPAPEKQYARMPWHLVDVWWDLGQDAPFESLGVDVAIMDLASKDGQVRVAATKAIFVLGKEALQPLRKAGAKQLTPRPPDAKGRRIDWVFSILDGLCKNPLEGYRTDIFLLQVEKTCTVDDVAAIGERRGFAIRKHNGIKDGYCTSYPDAGKDFTDLLREVLANEPHVLSMQLFYYCVGDLSPRVLPVQSLPPSRVVPRLKNLNDKGKP